MKFKSLEELTTYKTDIASKYEGGLPDYIIAALDEEQEELERINSKKPYIKLSYSELKQIEENKEQEFWENNEIEITKKEKRVVNGLEYNYEEPKKNEELIEKEKALSPAETRVLIDLCENDLYLFAVRYFSHYLKYPSSQFHKWLYSFFSRIFKKGKKRRSLKYAVAAPRGSAKSTLISTIIPIWCACYNKKRFIIIISNTVGLAEEFLTDIKLELETNEALLRDFPGVCGKGARWRADEIVTKNDIKILALGTGSQVRGRRFGIYRPDLLLMDDLETMEMVRSPKQLEDIRFNWLNKDVLFSGDETTDYVVLGTLLGKNSLLNNLLNPEEYPEWQNRSFAAVIKFSESDLWEQWKELYNDKMDKQRVETAYTFYKEHEEEMLEGTEVLWPEGRPYYALMVDKNKDESAFYSEQQNEPIDPTKIKVKYEDLHWENFVIHPKIKDELLSGKYYGALDPSLGKKSVSDYSVITTLCAGKSGYLYVTDINMKRRKVDDQIDEIIKLFEKFTYKLFGIETNAFQLVVSEMLTKRSREMHYHIPIEELQNYSDKSLRIEGVIPFLKDGTLVFDTYKYNNNRMYKLGVDQILTWTGVDDPYDDVLDCLEMVFRISNRRQFKMLTKSNNKD